MYTSDFLLSVIDTSDLPFGWDCEITQEEYKYDQSISFRLNKSSVTEHIASQILTIVLSITESVSTALFLLNDSTVFYWDKNTLLINNAFGYWDIGDRIKMVSELNYKKF